MINFPSKTDLEALQTFDEPLCLTIYLPYIEPNAATNPNRIELKSVLAEAEKALLKAGASPKYIEKTLHPARVLIDNHEFWPINHEGLALFMHHKMFHYYHVPVQSTPKIMNVAKGFNIEPLLKALAENKRYYVLTLGHKNVHLYEGDHYHLKDVHLKDFPSGMKEALGIDEYPKWRETHMIAPSYIGKGSEAVHGQYNVSQIDKEFLVKYFRRLDKRLHSFLRRKDSPLIIAGVGYLLPLYRQVNTFPRLVSEGIKGNMEHTNLDTLREKAWSLMGEEDKEAALFQPE